MRRDAPALLFAILFPPAAAWLYFIALAGHPAMPYLYAACKAVQFAFPAAWVLVSRLRSPLGIRAPLHPASRRCDSLAYQGVRGASPRLAIRAQRRSRCARDFWDGTPAVERIPLQWRRPEPGALGAGAIWGLVLGAGLIGFHRAAVAGTALASEAARAILRKTVEIGAGTPARYLALALFLAFLHSGLEEYYWRGFVFARLRDRIGFRWALPAGSLAFAAHHAIVLYGLLGPGNALAVAGLTLGVAAAGGLWAVLFHRHGGLTAPWVCHALADLAILAIGFRMIRGSF